MGRFFFSLPHLYTMTFLWPFPSPPMWVETYYVFFNEKITTQELTKRELGQLIDLRPKWEDGVAKEES